MTVQVLVQHVICSCKDQAWCKQTFIGLAAYNGWGGGGGEGFIAKLWHLGHQQSTWKDYFYTHSLIFPKITLRTKIMQVLGS